MKESLDKVKRFTQIATGTYVDQAGRPRLILYALDYTGALWCDDGDGDGWRRVEQPPASSRDTIYEYTRGIAG